MKDDPPLRVPDPSATIPDFGPAPDLSNAPNLAALMGGPSPMADSTVPKEETPKKPRISRSPPPPPMSRAPQQELAPPAPKEGGVPKVAIFIGVGFLLALLAGALAFGVTLLFGLGFVLFLG